jgi:hypothetical protein
MVSQSTGPILAVGGITLANKTLLNNQPMDWRIVIATGLTAGMFSLADKAWPELSKGLAYLALISVLFVRLDKNTPAPVESLAKWMRE